MFTREPFRTLRHRLTIRQATVIALCSLLAGGLVLERQRDPNWDLVPYTALVLESEGRRDLRTDTYDLLRQTLEPDAFEQLFSGRDSLYRRVVASDDRAFLQTLDFYRARPGYLTVLRSVSAAGWAVPRSAHLISLGAVLLAVAILTVSLRTRITPAAVALLPAALLLQGGASAGRVASPDALVVLCAATWYVLRSRPQPWGLVPLVAMVSLRPDSLILAVVAALMGRGASVDRRSWWVAAVLIVGAAIGWASADSQPPFAALLVSSFRSPLPTPHDAAVVWTWADHLKAAWNGAVSLARHPGGAAHLVSIAALVLGLRFGLVDRRHPLFVVVGAVVLVEVVRFVLFPAPWARLYAPVWFLVTAASAELLMPVTRPDVGTASGHRS